MPGAVFIGESIDEEPYMRSGVFDAHWESDDEGRFVDGPRGVPVDEAIAWGRAHADVVLVRSDDDPDPLSAGARHPGEGLGTWPEGRRFERRREPGMEHLDIEAGQPLRWELRIGGEVRLAVMARTHAEAMRQALRLDTGAGEPVAEGRAAYRYADWNPYTDLRPAS